MKTTVIAMGTYQYVGNWRLQLKAFSTTSLRFSSVNYPVISKRII